MLVTRDRHGLLGWTSWRDERGEPLSVEDTQRLEGRLDARSRRDVLVLHEVLGVSVRLPMPPGDPPEAPRIDLLA